MGRLDHGAEATKHLRAFIGAHYHYSEQPVFRALWDNYNACQFVEDTGEQSAGTPLLIDGCGRLSLAGR